MSRRLRSLLVLAVLSVWQLTSMNALSPALAAVPETCCYDLIEKAPEAIWGNGSRPLTFGGGTADSNGFACYRTSLKLEDGVTYAKVLQTHPEWVTHGRISGRYPEIRVAPASRLLVTVGFLQGATGSDGAKFDVYFVSGTQSTLLLSVTDLYDGKLQSKAVDLAVYAGKTGSFVLWVDAGNASGQDWAVWTRAKIEPLGVGMSTTELPVATKDQPYVGRLEACGGQTPYSWSVLAGTLPTGLVLNTSTGIISGIPRAAGTGAFRIQVADATTLDAPCYAARDFVIQVAGPGGTTQPQAQFDFSVGLNPAEATLDLTRAVLGEGDASASVSATVSVVAGAAQTVSLSVSGLPAGVTYTCLPREGFAPFTSGITLTATRSYLPAAGDYDVAVSATAGTLSRTRSLRLHVSSTVSGDLVLNAGYRVTRAVQVVDNSAAMLTAGKNTLFICKVSSTFDVPVSTQVELMLPADDWVWPGHESASPPRVLRTRYEDYVTFPAYLSYRRNVTIPARGEVELVLPDPATLESTTEQGYRVVSAPRPSHLSSWGASGFAGVEFGVYLDPDNRIAETNEINNYPEPGLVHVPVEKTRELRILYTIFTNTMGEAEGYFPDLWDGTELWDFYSTEVRLAEQGTAHVLGTYPIADEGKLVYDAPPVLRAYQPALGYRTWDDQELMNIMEHLSAEAASLGYDRLVAVVPEGWLARHGQGEGTLGETWDSARRSCYVEIECVDGDPWVVTHELMHNLGYGDIYGHGDVMAGDGYWVNENVRIYPASIHDYMDYAGNSDPQWTDISRYNYVQEHVSASEDPTILVFRAIVGRDGTAEIRPFVKASGNPDVSPQNWTHTIVALDAGGKILRETRLEARFVKYVEPAGEVSVDQVPVVSALEWVQGIRRIELRDKTGKVLAARTVSDNPPSVRLLAPNGGEQLVSGTKYRITWEASDLDGDKLWSNVSISSDKRAWSPLAMDLETNEFDLEVSAVRPGSYYVRVQVTDGVNTSEDVSEQSFTVKASEAKGQAADVVMWIGSQQMKVAGQSREIDPGRGTAPVIVGDRTLVPIRAIIEALGGTVEWEEATSKVTMHLGSSTVELWIDSPVGRVNGQEKSLDVPAKLINDRTMVPIRFVSENLRCQVDWNESEQSVSIRRLK